jgi:hypothetical protein
VLTAYFRDIVSRYHGRAATPGEVRAAIAAEPALTSARRMACSCWPAGTALSSAAANAAFSRPGPARSPAFRRTRSAPPRVGKQLLDAVEDAARQRFDHPRFRRTRSDLAEARQLYATNGYREVAPFNDGRFADQWYGKILG